MTTATDVDMDERTEAIRVVEGEFMNMANRFRRLVVQRAERLSPGLLPGSFKVFMTIANEGPITATAVGEQLMVDKGQLSRLVADLESRGLVERMPDPNDGRAQLLLATEEGQQRLEEVRQHPSERSMAHNLSEWDVADVQRLGDFLRALNEAANGADEA